jgi:hypothetical protein
MLLRGCSTVHFGDSSQRTARWQRCLSLGLHTAGIYSINCAAFSEFFENHLTSTGGQDNSVGIATRYGLYGAGIESRYGREFPHRSRLAVSASYKMSTGYFWGQSGRSVNLMSPPSSAGSRMGSSYIIAPPHPSLSGRVMG